MPQPEHHDLLLEAPMSSSVIEHPDVFRITASRASSSCTEVVPEGDLEAVTLPALVEAVDGALRAGARVELDLGGVDFMSIAAAAYVWRRGVPRSGATVTVTAASAAASRALVVTGFSGAVDV
ncbi:hypothetical protein TPB0596_15140 [Tsukamurella pulmonis]|nr:hypothetical protein TPB0596_15140 [Tsukamurella pulmonis]